MKGYFCLLLCCLSFRGINHCLLYAVLPFFCFLSQEGNRLEAAPRPPVALTNAVSWRSEGIKHRKNEIFLDVSAPPLMRRRLLYDVAVACLIELVPR